jgi:hypothetical protein
MAPNDYKILDEGMLKYYYNNICNTIKMDTYISQYQDEYYWNEALLEPVREYREKINEIRILENQVKHIEDVYEQDPYHERIGSLKMAIAKLNKQMSNKQYKVMKSPEEITKKEVYDYYGIIPYMPSVMINVSPAWKGKEIDKEMMKFFKIFMCDVFKDCDRFKDMKYVLECGFGGDLLHCHAVATINPKALKAVKSQINKGNLHRSIRKLWDFRSREGLEGGEGMWKEFENLLKNRHSIQIQILNKKNIKNDKLNYLIEENKPPSHKNKPHEWLPFSMSYGFD